MSNREDLIQDPNLIAPDATSVNTDMISASQALFKVEKLRSHKTVFPTLIHTTFFENIQKVNVGACVGSDC